MKHKKEKYNFYLDDTYTYTVRRAVAIKQAMKEAHTLGHSNNDDVYHNYIEQRIDDLLGELKWLR